MNALVAVFQIPILFLNFFGFIGAAIWLLIIGRWPDVVSGVLTTIVSPFVVGLAMLPALIFVAPGTFFSRRGSIFGLYATSFLSSVYTATLITAWCGGVAYFYLNKAPSNAFWPLLIWSYGVATSPWTYMAQKDDSVASTLAAFFTQVAFIALMIALLLGASLSAGVQIFGVVMAIEIFFHMRLVAEVQRAGLLN
jgi:hypothetical protein